MTIMRCDECDNRIETFRERVFDSAVKMTEDNPMYTEAAYLLLKKIACGKIQDGFKPRTIYDKHWTGLNREAVEIGLGELIKTGFLTEETTLTNGTGRPTTRYYFNEEEEEASCID